MKISRDITITLTDEEQSILEQAESILDKLSNSVMDNDLDDDYGFNSVYGLLTELVSQNGEFSFEGEECQYLNLHR